MARWQILSATVGQSRRTRRISVRKRLPNAPEGRSPSTHKPEPKWKRNLLWKNKLTRILLLVTALLTLAVWPALAENVPTQPIHWDFEADPEGQSPSGFSFGRTGSGRLGQWVIMAVADAPSGKHVLAQVDRDKTDFRFPVAVAGDVLLVNLRISVKCKPVSGEVDQSCGLLFRYQDENNYYVARANALEGNVRLYHVVNGDRRQFAGWNGSITAETWHELLVKAHGDHLVVSWDGQQVIDTRDQTFLKVGRVGLWTKADSVTYFDDLTVGPIGR